MPLLHKQPFQPVAPPDGIQPDTLLFHLEATGEVFLDHDSYIIRQNQLTSPIWSCSVTRKTNLTFREALQSENSARLDLQEFPQYLELPILFIVQNYTMRGRLDDVINDIYHIMKERFFINEQVTYTDKNRKLLVRVLSSYCLEEPMEDGMEVRDPLIQPPDCYKYNVQVIEPNVPQPERMKKDVVYDKLCRSKHNGSRQKIRLVLQNTCYLPPDGDRYQVNTNLLPRIQNLTWDAIMSGPQPICAQTPAQQRGRVAMKIGFHEGGGEKKKERRSVKKDENGTPRPRGRPPQTAEQKAQKRQEKQDRQRAEAGHDDLDLTQSGALILKEPPTKKKPRKSNEAKRQTKIKEQQGDLDFYFTEARRLGISVDGLEQEDRLLSPKKVSEFKQKVREGKDTEREKVKEEKRKKAKERLAYNKKREDLLCNDLKPMPRFPALELPGWMTNEEFGDYLFILQFFSAFQDILPLQEIRGTTEVLLSDVITAIKCHDPQNSPFADFMRVLLSIRTDICDQEDGDEADINNRDESALISAQNCDPANLQHGDAIRDANELHFKIRKIHGKSVRHLPVDWMTLTEVIRLIFETSGYYTGIPTHRHRLYTRGAVRGYEDPAYEFKIKHPETMEKLKTQTVFDLEPSERMDIVKTIIYQLLTYSKFRMHLEKLQGELNEMKKEQKRLKVWDAHEEGEATSTRILFEHNEKVINNGEVKETAAVKKLKAYIKAINEGRRYDKEDLDKILLEVVPYPSLSTLDEVVTARELQKAEYKTIMDALNTKLFSLYCKISDIRLGSDRAYRRYIILDSLSAILVESPAMSESCDEPSVIDNPENLEENEQQEVFRCTGDMDSCNVHGRHTRPHWSYIESPEQLERLMRSLNPRGVREVELLEQLQEFKSTFVEILESRDSDDEWKSVWMTDAPDPGDTYNINWDTEIREILMDFEEKLDQGMMGSIEKTFRVSRSTWRQQLEETGDVMDLLDGDSIPEDLDLSAIDSDSGKLAVAFYMIIKSINLKFIKPPHISPNKDEHGHLKPSELYNRYQKALLQCTSHSALSLFISTFEGSIKWDKSRLQGKCKSCRRKAQAHELILCSECDSCYHLKCAKLDEALTDWACTSCRAQQRKVENEAKRQKMRMDESEMTLKDMSIDDEGGSSETTIKTQSGRAVKKIQYSTVHEGVAVKSRKSNGAGTTMAAERPQRNVSARVYDDDSNGISDEEESEPESTRKRKVAVKKATQDSPRSIPVASTFREKISQCEALLKEAMRQDFSWPFNQPVDSKEAPDYTDVIERPMDLGTMINKIKQRIYNRPSEIRDDFKLIISNCETYNETESEVCELSQKLDEFVSQRLNAIID